MYKLTNQLFNPCQKVDSLTFWNFKPYFFNCLSDDQFPLTFNPWKSDENLLTMEWFCKRKFSSCSRSFQMTFWCSWHIIINHFPLKRNAKMFRNILTLNMNLEHLNIKNSKMSKKCRTVRKEKPTSEFCCLCYNEISGKNFPQSLEMIFSHYNGWRPLTNYIT